MTTKNPLSTDIEQTDDAERTMKIQALRDMVNNAERTIQSAKAMLLQLEGKKKTGRPRKIDTDAAGGTVIEGTFDGQLMTGANGKQYPVPANYASKSKLVEGDMLKLTITDDGAFLYKQIGPIDRRHAIGIMTQDENGNHYVVANGKPYRVLLASITYFKAQPGDEVAIVMPHDLEASWAAIENVIQKGSHTDWETDLAKASDAHSVINNWKQSLKEDYPSTPTSQTSDATDSKDTSVLDVWVRDMEEIEKEINGSR
jgi:hypothetical protein